jgi:predicted SAM-dependent methyltransferase
MANKILNRDGDALGAFRDFVKRHTSPAFRTRIKIARHYVLRGHFRRTLVVMRYLRQTIEPKLQVGCGGRLLEGWLNADIYSGDVYLNATKKLPFKDETFNYVFCEQFIEHITLSEGLRFLSECYRILKPNGIIRITTPDLERLIDIYHNAIALKEFMKIDAVSSPCEFFNSFFNPAHKIVYDRKLLAKQVEKAKFKNIVFQDTGKSSHLALMNIEKHLEEYRDPCACDLNLVCNQILEAQKVL